MKVQVPPPPRVEKIISRMPTATKTRMAAATKAIQNERAARVSTALKTASIKTGLFRS